MATASSSALWLRSQPSRPAAECVLTDRADAGFVESFGYVLGIVAQKRHAPTCQK